MTSTRISVDHVQLTSDKAFDAVCADFERPLGKFDASAYKALTDGEDAMAVRAKLEAMVGPSGFLLFATHHHGALLRIVDHARNAVQYIVGNPLYAIQMTQHDIRAGLYAPLRVLIYEKHGAGGRATTCIEYDLPSSLFGQFGNAQIDAVARSLDEKLAALTAKALG